MVKQVCYFEKVFLNNNSIKYLKREKYYEVKDSLDLYLFEVIGKAG